MVLELQHSGQDPGVQEVFFPCQLALTSAA